MIAGFILFGLAGIFFLIAVVAQIMLLVKIFKHAGVGLGILGIFCGPFSFIWGWMKSTEFGLKKLMIWLTVSIIAVILLYLGGTAALVASPEAQAKIKEAQQQMQLQQPR